MERHTIDIAQVFEAIRPRYPEFKGQVALITGSSQGIGEGIALRLAREGMKIILHGIDQNQVMSKTEAFRALGVDVLGIATNFSQPGAVNELFEALSEQVDRLDLLVNNAADLYRTHIEQATVERLDYQLAVNLRAPYLCSLEAAKLMQPYKQGNIVNITSVGAQRAHWRGLPYDMTKGGMDAMTRAMALELARDGIRVNAIAPGAVRTTKTPPESDGEVQAQVARIPMARMGTILEVGAAVAFLASDDARYITGHILNVDGGISAQISPPGQEI